MIYIHLGSWKTGTTTIQATLRNNLKYLEENDIFFFDQYSKEHKEEFSPQFRNAIKGLRENSDSKETIEYVDRAVESFINYSDRKKHVIHSWEPFLGHPFKSSPYNMYHAETTATWFKHALKDRDFKFIFYFRKQIDFIEGMYAQEVRKGRFLDNMDEFMSQFLPTSLSWLPVIEPFINKFGRESIKIIPFETIKEGPEKFLKIFFEPILNSSPLKKVLHSNPSFSHVAVEIARVAYPFISKTEFPLLEKFLVQNFSNNTHPRCKFLSDEIRKIIFEDCRADNELLFSKYLTKYDPVKLGYV